MKTTSRWSGDEDVRDVVREAVRKFTGEDVQVEFEPKDIKAVVLKKYPHFKKNTVDGQIAAGCPNHGSYHHHSGNHKLYWKIGHGKYRLYNAETDNLE